MDPTACSGHVRDSLEGRGGARGKVGRGGDGRAGTKGRRSAKIKSKERRGMLAIPLGWVAPAIGAVNRVSPPILRESTQKARVVRNLLATVDATDISHGAHRLMPVEGAGNDNNAFDEVDSPLGTQIQLISSTPRDCKEAPCRTLCTRGNKGKGVLRSDNSGGWYTSCKSDNCLQHCALGLENSNDREDAHKVMVTVPLGILGLSPTLNAGHNMAGEVVR